MRQCICSTQRTFVSFSISLRVSSEKAPRVWEEQPPMLLGFLGTCVGLLTLLLQFSPYCVRGGGFGSILWQWRPHQRVWVVQRKASLGVAMRKATEMQLSRTRGRKQGRRHCQRTEPRDSDSPNDMAKRSMPLIIRTRKYCAVYSTQFSQGDPENWRNGLLTAHARTITRSCFCCC